MIDLFAGTGAFGLEAVSRGAEFCQLVDDGAEARALLRGNVEALGLGGVTKIFRRDARKLGDAPSGPPYTLAFLDPPYGKGLAEPALDFACRRRLAGARRRWSSWRKRPPRNFRSPQRYEMLERRDYGDTEVVFLRYRGEKRT